MLEVAVTPRKSWLIAAVVLGATCVLVAKLALSPFWPRWSADECRAAYAQSRSLADTLRLDLHPLRGERGERGVQRYCGEVRAVAQDTTLLASHTR